jgi:type VI secretion system secreted protein VgrG
MPSPKAGTPGTIVPPAEPKEALDADEANPGQVETVKAGQRETGTGKYGSNPVKPFKPPQTPEEKKQKKSWIEIALVDEDDNPVPGASYRITLPDDSVASGTTDGKGSARVEGFDPGSCKITFPDLDGDLWTSA